MPKVILFRSKKSAVSLPVKSLSVKFFKKLVIGQVYLPINSEVAKRFNIPSGNDTLIIIPPSNNLDPIVYNGSLKYTPLVEFLSRYAEKTDWDLERHTTEL